MQSAERSAYRQLPAWSPLSAAVLGRALVRAVTQRDPRRSLGQLLAERYAADRVELFASGTQALQTALSIVRRTSDDVALLPAYTCYEVATAAAGANIRVALYDLDPATLRPDPASVRRAAQGKSVVALVAAPLYGTDLDWSAMRDLARELDTILIEDAAQAIGSVYADRPVGSFGDLSILSFGRGKGWTGMGGGALLMRGDGSAQAAARLRTAARTRAPGSTSVLVKAAAQWLLARPRVYGLPASIPALRLGETVYHEPSVPRPMARLSAALVLEADALSRGEATTRRRHADEYRARLTAGSRLRGMVGAHSGTAAGMLRFPVLVAGGWAAARESGADRLGAGPPYPTTLDQLPALARLLANPGAPHSGADRIVRELVTLPTHSRTRPEERTRLCAWLESGDRRFDAMLQPRNSEVLADDAAEVT